MMVPPLSVLDQSPVVSGRGPAESLRESLALAALADRLGFRRYWVAEHHNTDSLASSAPEILISAIAATTARIRVGSAGVMLPHYAPLKVAEQFRMLEGIAPGRIDLGLGRAPGSDGLTAHALNPDAARAAERFPADLRDLLGWLGDGLPAGHPFAAVRAAPAVATAPEVWVLGSSDYGAQVAAHFGLPYCFAHFITDGRGAAEALAIYRENFRPGVLPAPRAALCAFALAADTEAEAWNQFRSRELARLLRDRGRYVPLPSLAEVDGYPFTDEDRARIERKRGRALVGTGARVAAGIAALAAECGADEVAVLTACHDPAARRRSYEVLAAAAGMTAAEVPAAA